MSKDEYFNISNKVVTFREVRAIMQGKLPSNSKYCAVTIKYNDAKKQFKFFCKHCNKEYIINAMDINGKKKIIDGHYFSLNKKSLTATCKIPKENINIFKTVSSRFSGDKLLKDGCARK